MYKLTILVLLTILLSIVSLAQVSVFPYGPYNWTGAAALSGTGGGDGNYMTSRSAGQAKLWQTSLTGGTSDGPCAMVTGWKKNETESYLDLLLSTTGFTFTGGEAYDFWFRVSAVPAPNIGKLIVRENSTGSFVDVAGPYDLSIFSTSMQQVSVLLPSTMGNMASVTLRIVILSSSNSTSTPSAYVDDNTISGGALPVQIASVSHRVDNVDNSYNVTIEWSTVSETNNFGFYVERRSNGETNFTTIQNSFIEGNGTTLEQHNYSWVDVNVPMGNYEYRIKQVDLDGLESYTQTIQVVLNGALGVKEESAPIAFGLRQNYPNPFNPTTNISFSVIDNQITTLKVYNVLGEEVATLFNGIANAGKLYTVTFDASNLSNGIYLYRIDNGSNVQVRKMSLIK